MTSEPNNPLSRLLHHPDAHRRARKVETAVEGLLLLGSGDDRSHGTWDGRAGRARPASLVGVGKSAP